MPAVFGQKFLSVHDKLKLILFGDPLVNSISKRILR